MPTPVQTTIERIVVSKLTLRLVPFLFLLYIVAYLDRINVGFAALQLKEYPWFSDEVYGNGAGMFFLGYFLFQVPSNLILERVGAKRWVALLMVIWGIISSCTMFIHSVSTFYTARFLLGLAEAGFFPGVIYYLKNWFPSQARAQTVAWFMTAAALSAVVGGPVSGALLNVRAGGLAGWQWMFLLEGLPAIALGFVVLVFLTDRPEKADWLSEDHRSWLIDTLERERQAIGADSPVSFVSLLGNLNIWLLAVVYFGLNVCSYGISLWLPTVIRSLSAMGNVWVGVLTAVPYVAAAITMVIVGHHSDRTGERKWHTAMCALVASLALVAGAFLSGGSVAITMIFITIAVMSQFSMMAPFWAMPTSFLRGTAAAMGIALINSLGNLGGFFGPYAIGKVRAATGSFRDGLLFVAATLLVACICGLLVKVKKESRTDTPVRAANI